MSLTSQAIPKINPCHVNWRSSGVNANEASSPGGSAKPCSVEGHSQETFCLLLKLLEGRRCSVSWSDQAALGPEEEQATPCPRSHRCARGPMQSPASERALCPGLAEGSHHGDFLSYLQTHCRCPRAHPWSSPHAVGTIALSTGHSAAQTLL